jgi:Cu(I)/Ag(I) efflux system membrane protein CusA/SilA
LLPTRHSPRADLEAATIEGAVHRLRPKLMTVAVVLASLVPILSETGVGETLPKRAAGETLAEQAQ